MHSASPASGRGAWNAPATTEANVAARDASTLARSSLRRRLRRRLLDPWVGADPIRWRNTTRGVRLFVRASFSGLAPARLPEDADNHLVSALFVFGAIGLAGDLADLPPRARRRIELGFLRGAYGLSCLRARHVRRTVRLHGEQPRGRIALREGRVALREWFDGMDPGQRLRGQIERMPGEWLDLPGRRPLRVRPARGPAFARGT